LNVSSHRTLLCNNGLRVYNDKTDYTGLLKRLKAFDLDAFEELYVQTRERLFVYALSILKDEDTAQDVVQELFVDFWETQLFLHIHTELAGYLVRTVRNRCLDYKKREQNQERLRKEHFGTDAGITAPDAIEAWALGKEIEAAIAQLPPMPAKVFRLHYVDKFSYAEIADQLHISPNTVSNHMAKALKELRKNLKKN